VGARRRPEAEDLLQIAEHRRSMQALSRVAAEAKKKAVDTAAARPSDVDADAPQQDANVRSLAARRARRAGHPAGSARRVR
jgi:hypothetical protein